MDSFLGRQGPAQLRLAEAHMRRVLRYVRPWLFSFSLTLSPPVAPCAWASVGSCGWVISVALSKNDVWSGIGRRENEMQLRDRFFGGVNEFGSKAGPIVQIFKEDRLGEAACVTHGRLVQTAAKPSSGTPIGRSTAPIGGVLFERWPFEGPRTAFRGIPVSGISPG